MLELTCVLAFNIFGILIHLVKEGYYCISICLIIKDAIITHRRKINDRIL